MSVKSNINNRIDQAKAFADRLRRVYRDAYEKAIEATSEKVDDLRRVGEHLDADIVREAIVTKVQAAQKIVDDLNKSLADKAVPAFRKQGSAADGSATRQETKTAVKQVVQSQESNAAAEPTKKPRARKTSANTKSPVPKSSTKKPATVTASKAPAKRRVSSKKPSPDATSS